MNIILLESQVKKLLSEISVEVVKGVGAIVTTDTDDEMDEKNAVSISLDKLIKNQPEDQGELEKDYNKMVDRIIKKLKEKKKLLPIVVAKENKKYRIIDGHHRYDAYKKLGKETIKSIVIPEKDVKFKNLTKKMEKKLKGK